MPRFSGPRRGAIALLAASLTTGTLASPTLMQDQPQSLYLSVAPVDEARQTFASNTSAPECFDSYGVFPAWDAVKREQVPHALLAPSATKLSDGACSSAHDVLFAAGGRAPLEAEGKKLYWVSQIAVEPRGDAVNIQADDKDWATRLVRSLGAASNHEEGLVFQSRSADGQLLTPHLELVTEHYAILSLPSTDLGEQASSVIDKYLTFDSYISLIPSRPSPKNALSGQPSIAEDDDVDYGHVVYNPLVSVLLKSPLLDKEEIRSTVRVLSGENQSAEARADKKFQTWDTRHSATTGARSAASWIKSEMQDALKTLPNARCKFWEYSVYYSPDVICTIPASTANGLEDGEDDGMVLISAHYDSRGTFGDTRAPGADDDGSGTAALLSIARAIGSQNVRFGRDVQLCFFSGEEQGLVGSDAYARYLYYEKQAKIHFMMQIDMIGYRVEGEP